MAQRQRAHVNPEILVWARGQTALSIAAASKRIGVKPEKLESWEKGTDKPTVKQLREAARIYRFTLAVFFLPTPPQGYQPIRDYRRLPTASGEGLSPDLALELRRAYDRRDVALELYTALDEAPPAYEIEAVQSEDPEELASRLRDRIAVSLEEQRAWRATQTAFREWRSTLERAGILVFQAKGIPVAEMRGFSIAAFPLPVIVVNRADAYAGRIFTLFHELTHVALRSAGVCNLDEHGPQSADVRQTEVFCNHVAGAALVPAEALLRHREVMGRRSPWDAASLEPIARDFLVSRQVIIRRLLTLGRATQSTYDSVMRDLERDLAAIPKRKGGFLAPHDNTLSLAGRLYARLALSAYHENRITASTLSDFLGLRLRHIAALEHRVMD